MINRQNSKKFDLIMLNMSDYIDWDQQGIVNRNFFILQEFIKSKQVGKILAIDFPPHNYKRAIKSYITRNKYNKYKNIRSGLCGNTYKISDRLYIYHSEETVCSMWEHKMYDKINRIVKELNFKDIVLWSYLPTLTKYFDKINADLRVFDAVDNWSEHGSYQNFKDRLINNYRIIDEKADIIFTVSKELKKLFKNNKNVHWIPNGVDAKHFNIEKKRTIPEDIRSIKKPIVGYVGIVQDRFDVDLLEYLLKNNQDKSFVIIGMVWPVSGLNRLAEYKNLHLLGQKKYQDLPRYINQFKVAIIPHKVNEFTKSMNPMKLYEYMAAGKPVITTPIAGSEQFDKIIKVADTYEDFNHKINQAVELDDQDRKIIKQSKKIAQENSWSSRFIQMMKIINNY